MVFGRRTNAAPAANTTTATTSDYGAPAIRTHKLHRPLLALTHALHLICALIVLGISAYFINNYTHNTHLVYWVSLSSISTLLYLPALALPTRTSYTGYLAPLPWLFSYLWLTAFIFAAQDYEYNGGCAVNSPRGVGKCGLKRTLEAFAFLGFFTTLVATVLEAGLWHFGRLGARSPTVAAVEKQHGMGVGAGAAPTGNVARESV